MTNQLIETIISKDQALRNRSVDSILKDKGLEDLLMIAGELETFRRSSLNLYHKVRASLFLFVLFRYYIHKEKGVRLTGTIPFNGIKAAYAREFEKAIEIYLEGVRIQNTAERAQTKENNLNAALCSAVADAYYKLTFQYLLDQVKLSISHCKENSSLFNILTLGDYTYSTPPEMTVPDPATGLYPVGLDTSPVRLDPSHSGWSDIFFLGMDFPEGARVVNISVNLKIHGSDAPILPPCECYCRYIEKTVIRLTSVDLRASKDVDTMSELFNFGNDYLSLLKAGVVASGLIPPSFENTGIDLRDILQKLLGKPGGIEVVTRVNNIPKGSRLAVSTALLATIITRLMRFSGQISNLEGSLTEEERRTVASRAILGEWLGGSGGGWQDSGGLWPGIKVITGILAERGDPEYGLSRGCLLPEHKLLPDLSGELEEKIINSMVIVHGGISQDVGPVLEMVTEKYLLKHEKEWAARLKGISLFDEIVSALKSGNMQELGRLTTKDWEDSIQHIIPWVNNTFTEELISRVRDEFREDYWGFLMLGGMSGGGMAFIVKPSVRESFMERIAVIMQELKEKYNRSLPFIIDPAVYDLEINNDGIIAHLLKGIDAEIPGMLSSVQEFENRQGNDPDEAAVTEVYGLDAGSHEHMKSEMKRGEISLRKNRLPLTVQVEDVDEKEIFNFEEENAETRFYKIGVEALSRNEVAVITFAGGLGSRWSSGSAVVKPISPFIKSNGRYRTFLEIHIAKSRKTDGLYGSAVQHVFTTSYLTHNAIREYLQRFNFFDSKGQIYISKAKTIGRRVYPMARDLRFLKEEEMTQRQERNIQKVLDDVHNALIEWTKERGEGEDYSENSIMQRFNPPGHWHEIPNLIKNGVLAEMLMDNPDLKYLLCHNIDTVGAHIDPALLGVHIDKHSCLTFEVTPRRVEDRGGGLAKVDGHIRLIEGLALPKEEYEYRLSYYNSLTNWITIDSLLEFFKLDRAKITGAEERPEYRAEIIEAIQRIEKRIPTYITIKNVKYLWGNGQEDIHPVAQFEKLWGDMTGLGDLSVGYAVVSRYRGQQLKKPSQLNFLMADGSFDYLESKCAF